MNQHLKDLLRSVFETDPDATLDDDGRQAVMYAMLALHPPEHLAAILKFADSITDEFKRSHLLHKLTIHSAERLEFSFAERTARSIPIPYWRYTALNKIAAELLRREREFGGISAGDSGYREWAMRLLQEIEQGLPSIPEEDRERRDLLWRGRPVPYRFREIGMGREPCDLY